MFQNYGFNSSELSLKSLGWWLLTPIILHHTVSFLDEVISHRRRSQTRGEQLNNAFNHFFLGCYWAAALFWPVQSHWILVVGILTAFYLILIIKEEFIHKPEYDTIELIFHLILNMNTPLMIVGGFATLLVLPYGPFIVLGQGVLSILLALLKIKPKSQNHRDSMMPPQDTLHAVQTPQTDSQNGLPEL